MHFAANEEAEYCQRFDSLFLSAKSSFTIIGVDTIVPWVPEPPCHWSNSKDKLPDDLESAILTTGWSLTMERLRFADARKWGCFDNIYKR